MKPISNIYNQDFSSIDYSTYGRDVFFKLFGDEFSQEEFENVMSSDELMKEDYLSSLVDFGSRLYGFEQAFID